MRINAPDFPGPHSSGKLNTAGDAKAGVKTGSPNQIRPFSPLLTTSFSLLTKLGLSQDKLSASIVAFARYFSLPLDPALLTKIRHQILSADTGGTAAAKSPQNSLQAVLQNREALSLAAAAAVDKGVELSREALADYAAAIDPDKRRSADGGHEDGGGFGAGDNHGDSNMAGGDGGSNAGNGAGGSPNKDRDKDPWDGKSLRNKILRAEGQNPLLSLMNRLPGKKGRQWMVFPFVFEDQGRAFAATLRVLLTPEGSIMGESPAGASGFRAERMALEIAGEAQRWLFIADNPPGGRLRLTGSLWPGISGSEKMTAKALQSWEKELAGLLGSIPEQVRIQNAGEFSPFAPDSRDETLLSVNEEV